MATSSTVNLGGGPPQGGGPPPVKRPPLPVLAAIVGGGLGLLVFAYNQFRKAQVTGAQGSASSPQQVQASVPIMLGSLQQSLLDLQGQVGSGVAGLTSEVDTTGAATQNLINSSTAALASSTSNGLTTVQGNLTDLITAQGQQYTDLLQKRSDALQSALDSLGSQVTEVGSGQDALSKALHDAYAALQGDLSSVQTDISTVNQSVGGLQQQVSGVAASQASLSAQASQTQATLTGLGGIVSSILGRVNQAPTSVFDWSPLEGKYIFGSPNGDRSNAAIFKVTGGNLYAMTWSGYVNDSHASAFDMARGVEITDPTEISKLAGSTMGVIKAPGQTTNYG